MFISRTRILILTLACFAGTQSAFSAEPPTKTKCPLLVTISKETTYITEPLRNDGYPDYFAALNARMSKGVTPENNAAVLFWKAVGPKAIPKEQRERHFRMLGIPVLPEKGDYFVTLDEYVARKRVANEGEKDAAKRIESLRKERASLMDRPWSRREYPFWAGWIEINERPLQLVAEACRRTRRFEPLLPNRKQTDMLLGVLLPAGQISRECALAFAVRATLRIHEGKTGEAWSDVLSCYRMSRLVGQGAFAVNGLVSFTLNWYGDVGLRVLLDHGKLTSVELAHIHDNLASLPPLCTMADKCDGDERYAILDCMMTVARKGPIWSKNSQHDSADARAVEPLVKLAAEHTLDWDIVLRVCNRWHSRMVAAMRLPVPEERRVAIAKFEEDLKMLKKKHEDTTVASILTMADRRAAISTRAGELAVLQLCPACESAQYAEDRTVAQFALSKLACAVARYRAAHGSCPSALADLVPIYIGELPKDVFGNDDIYRYTQQPDGYMLYSVGFNGKDDAGKQEEEARNGEGWDDLTVRIPAASR